MTENDFPARFLTIRQLAKSGFLPEAALRRLLVQGQLPGFYSGRKFLINTAMLAEMVRDPESAFSRGKGVG